MGIFKLVFGWEFQIIISSRKTGKKLQIYFIFINFRKIYLKILNIFPENL